MSATGYRTEGTRQRRSRSLSTSAPGSVAHGTDCVRLELRDRSQCQSRQVPRPPDRIAGELRARRVGRRTTGRPRRVSSARPRRNAQHIGSIWGVYVTPACRGRGLGRRLLASMIERARDLQGLEHVLLSVTSENAAALALYRVARLYRVGHRTRGAQSGRHRLRRDAHAAAALGQNQRVRRR